jgi:hypothetical protein
MTENVNFAGGLEIAFLRILAEMPIFIVSYCKFSSLPSQPEEKFYALGNDDGDG